MGGKKERPPTAPIVLLGKYELGRVLGHGSFAKVVHARKLETGDSVAMKVVSKDKIEKVGMSEQIKREISVMKRVSHPNIVKLHEVMATKSKIYIAMEYVTGGELFSVVAAKGRLGEPAAGSYFAQLLSAVDFCHSRGVFHRDLKPENLLLDGLTGGLKITDFGLSALSEHLRHDGLLHTACGTPAYVAPEVIGKKGYDGAKADLWSCGVVLFVLLAGYLPFHDENIMVMYRKIRRGEFRFPPWISGEARRVVRRLLDANPSTRITASELMDTPWFKKQSGSGGGLLEPERQKCEYFGVDYSGLETEVELKKHSSLLETGQQKQQQSNLEYSGCDSSLETKVVDKEQSSLLETGQETGQQKCEYFGVNYSGRDSSLETEAAEAQNLETRQQKKQSNLKYLGTEHSGRDRSPAAAQKHINPEPGQQKQINAEYFGVDYSGRDSSSLLQKQQSETLNAFHIISLSEGLDLSGLFESGEMGMRRFGTGRGERGVVEGLEEAARAGRLSLKRSETRVRMEGKEMGRKGRLGIAAEMFTFTPTFMVVEVNKDGGDTFEYNRFCNDSLRPALKDIVWTPAPPGNSTVAGFELQ